MKHWIATLAIMLAPSAVQAARIISIDIDVDGKPALHGQWADDGFAGKLTVWRYLKLAVLHPVTGFKFAGEGNAILKGDIVVRIRYGAEARTRELRLKAAPKEGWLIDPDWVEANGPPGDPGEEQRRVAAIRAEHRAERSAYHLGSMAAIGAAAASWAACLALLACVIAGHRGQGLNWLLVAAVALAILVVSLRFIGRPYFPEDERAYDLRGYAFYAAAAAGVVALGTRVVARWRKASSKGDQSI